MEDVVNQMILPFAKSLILAAIVWLVGREVIRNLTRILERRINRSKVDDTLKPFIASIVSNSLKVLLAISVIGILGIETTSFAAIIGAAGLAIGLAFQGSLSNFAGGVLLLVTRPIDVGDYIEADGYSGTVEAIDILNTRLKTPDNKIVYMPNSNLSDTNITNYSVEATRRVDWTIGVDYEEDIEEVKRVLREVVEAHPDILEDPAVFVRLTDHGDSSLNFTVRAWVLAENFWPVKYDILEEVKKRFDKEDISMPFPQMDVHMG